MIIFRAFFLMTSMPQLLPLFLDLTGRRVLLVGGGPVAAAKLAQLLAVGAEVHLVAPEVCGEIERTVEGTGVAIERRGFEPADLDGVWLVVAAATPEVNRLGGRGRRASPRLRERGRRSGERERVSERRRAAGRRHAGDFHRRRRAWIDGVAAPGARPRPAARSGGLGRGSARAARRAGVATACRWTQRRPLLLQALNELYKRQPPEHTEPPSTERTEPIPTTTEAPRITEPSSETVPRRPSHAEKSRLPKPR